MAQKGYSPAPLINLVLEDKQMPKPVYSTLISALGGAPGRGIHHGKTQSSVENGQDIRSESRKRSKEG
jgi:hypothetical protein